MLIIGASVSDKIKLIKEAVSWHSKLVREAATGTTNYSHVNILILKLHFLILMLHILISI